MNLSAVKFAVRLVGFCLLGLVIVAGLGVWWVSHQSPASQNALNAFFARALSQPLDTASARVSRSKAQWDAKGGLLRFRLEDVTFVQPTSEGQPEHVVARLPTLDVAIDPWRLIQGHAVLEELSVAFPFFLMVREEDGTLRLGLGSQDTHLPVHSSPPQDEPVGTEQEILSHVGEGMEVADVVAALRVLLTHPSAVPTGQSFSASYPESLATFPLAGLLSHVSSISTQGARVLFLDQKRSALWTFPSVSLRVERGQEATTLDADIALTTQEEDSHIRVQGLYDIATQTLDVTAKSASLKPSVITGLAGALPVLGGFDMPVSGTLSARLVARDHVKIEDVAVELRGEAGRMRLPRPLNITVPVNYLELSAYAMGHDTGAGPRPSPNSFAWPADVSWDLAIDLGDVDSSDGVSRETYVSAVGALTTSDPGSDAKGHVTLTADHMPVERLADLWPAQLTPLPRSWILENMRVGTLGGTWELDVICDRTSHPDLLPRIAVTDLSGRGHAQNMTVSYLDGMPSVKRVMADLEFARDRLDIKLTHGIHRNLVITGGTVALRNLDQEDNDASILLNVSGPFRETLGLLDEKPLGYIHALGVNVDGASGHADTVLSLEFPLQTDLTLSMLSAHATAQIREATIRDIALNRHLEQGMLNVEVDKEGFQVKGSGLFDTAPVTFDWEERFAARPFLKRYRIQLQMDDAYRRRSKSFMSFLPHGFLRGPAQLNVTGVATAQDSHDLDLHVDLEPTHMSIAALGWAKPADVPAALHAAVRVRDGQLDEISSLSLKSSTNVSPLFLEGKVSFDSDGRLAQAHFEDVRIGKSHATLHAKADGKRKQTKVNVTGSYLDLSPLFDQDVPAAVGPPDSTVGFDEVTPSQSNAEHMSPLVVDLAFAKVQLAKGQIATSLKGATTYRNSQFEKMNVTSLLGDGTPAQFQISPSDNAPDTRLIRFVTEDAGLFARTLGIVETMRGGKVTLSGTLNHQGVAEGDVRVRPYRLVKTPLLARLLSIAALTGIVDALTGEGIAFNMLHTHFVYDSQRERLVITDFRTSGASLGMTGRGTVWFASNQVDLAGSIIPAYVFNNLLSRVPFIGWLLSGFEEGGGIIGLNYSIKGKARDPKLTTSPLSVLAPSFLRRLFSAGDEPVLPLSSP